MTYYETIRSDYGADTKKPTHRPLQTKEHYELMTCPWRIGMLTGFAWFLGLVLATVKRSYRRIKRIFKGRIKWQHRELLWRGLGLIQSPGYMFQIKKVPRDYDALFARTNARRMFEAPLRGWRRFRRYMRRPMRMAGWGFAWGFWECFFVSLRGHEDPLNGVLAGAFMQIKKGGIMWRKRKGKGRIYKRGGWHKFRFGKRRWYRMPFFLALFEIGGFLPMIYGRYIAPLPIDWEDYGSPNDVEDALGTVRRRAEKARDERTTWILPLVSAIRQRVIGLPDTFVVPPAERQVGKAATDQFRSKDAVGIEHNKQPSQFRLTASDFKAK